MSELEPLSDDELDTIEAIGRNAQTGRITGYEVRQLVAMARRTAPASAEPDGYVAGLMVAHETATERYWRNRALKAEALVKELAEALDSSAALLEVIAEAAQANGDDATWALAAVMAEKARAVLIARSRAEGI